MDKEICDKQAIYIEKLENLIQKKLSDAHETSPETDKRLIKLEKAIFGDDENIEDVGMRKMVMEIHDILGNAKFLKKITIKLIAISGGIVALAGSIVALALGLKELFKK